MRISAILPQDHTLYAVILSCTEQKLVVLICSYIAKTSHGIKGLPRPDHPVVNPCSIGKQNLTQPVGIRDIRRIYITYHIPFVYENDTVKIYPLYDLIFNCRNVGIIGARKIHALSMISSNSVGHYYPDIFKILWQLCAYGIHGGIKCSLILRKPDHHTYIIR